MAESSNKNVFPVVHRIREEIDFCFAAFYGDSINDQAVCDRAFEKWVKKGYRGPGQLSLYIKLLSKKLPNETQRQIFSNLAHDCISIVKKSPKSAETGVGSTNRFWIVFSAVSALLVILLVAMMYLLLN